MNILLFNNKNVLTFIQWITKGGRHIPISDKHDVGESSTKLIKEFPDFKKQMRVDLVRIIHDDYGKTLSTIAPKELKMALNTVLRDSFELRPYRKDKIISKEEFMDLFKGIFSKELATIEPLKKQ